MTAALAPLLGTDPLYSSGLNWQVVLIVLIKVLVVFGALMVAVMLMIWFERKVISDMQSRIGPNRAGPFGIAQTLADGIKLFFKEDLIPDKADRFVFKLAPYLTIIPAFLAFAIVPIGGEVTLFGHTFELQLADPPMGILFLLAMSAIAVYGVMLAGWSSGSKYPLLGSVRASAQMISYEAALGLTVVMVVLITGSLSTRTIVNEQAGHLWQWNVIRLGRRPVPDLLHRRRRRNQPSPLRPGRGRAGAGRRLPHRVLLDPLRVVLPGRVHEHHHHVGDHGDPVLRRPRRPHTPHSPHRVALADPVVPGQDHPLPLRATCGSAPPCRGSATTSSWTSAGSASSRSRWAGC